MGLVDVIGDLDDAIAIAAETADIQDDYGIQEYPYIEANMFQKVLAEIGKETRLAKVIAPRTQLEKQVVEQYSMMRQLLQCQEPQMLLPFAY